MVYPLTLKKILLVLGSITIYSTYFNTRYNRNNRRQKPTSIMKLKSNTEQYLVTTLDYKFFDSFDKYQKTRNINIKYSSDNNFLKNSIILKETYDLNFDNFTERGLLDICKSKNTCVTADLRTFIYAYFKEVTKTEMFTSYIKIDKKVYLLKEDTKGILMQKTGEECLRALGLMLSLALATETFLDLEFSSIFLVQNSRLRLRDLLDYDLFYYDRDQHNLYSSIQYNGSTGLMFGYDPKSSKPFTEAFDSYKNRNITLYSAESYPIDEALQRIFIIPFEKSTRLINESVKNFFGKPITLVNSSTFEYNEENYFQVDIRGIFTDKGGNFDQVEWRDNSVYDSSTRMFWKALNNFSPTQRQKIFLNITGLSGIPLIGVARWPKTIFKAYSEPDIKFVPALFEVWIPAYSSLEQMETILYKYIKIKPINK